MVDTPVLETGVRKDVRVRVSLWVQNMAPSSNWTGHRSSKARMWVRIPQELQKGQKLVWYSGGLLNRGEWDRYPPDPQNKCTDGRVANATACKAVVERPSGVRVPLCAQMV